MHPGLFADWSEDRRFRRTMTGCAEGQSGHESSSLRAPMGELLFIVSRADPKTYTYLKNAMASEGVAVITDRRNGDRRRVHQTTASDRRNGDRRRRDVTADLQIYGWAVVRR